MKRFIARKHRMLLLLCSCAINITWSQKVTITIDVTHNKRAVSPYIYGRNQSFEKPPQFYKDGGLRFSSMKGINNLNVDVPSKIAEPAQMIIYDAAGRKVKYSVEAFDGHSPMKLSVSTIAADCYVLQVQNKHVTATKNFTIKR